MINKISNATPINFKSSAKLTDLTKTTLKSGCLDTFESSSNTYTKNSSSINFKGNALLYIKNIFKKPAVDRTTKEKLNNLLNVSKDILKTEKTNADDFKSQVYYLDEHKEIKPYIVNQFGEKVGTLEGFHYNRDNKTGNLVITVPNWQTKYIYTYNNEGKLCGFDMGRITVGGNQGDYMTCRFSNIDGDSYDFYEDFRIKKDGSTSYKSHITVKDGKIADYKLNQ